MPNDVINTVTINGTTYDIGGSGGHTIKNPAGTAMTQRSNLQFVDLTVSDDSTNDVTKVENIHMIQSESELENLPDGLYMLDDDEGTVIDGNLVGYDNTDSGLNAENVQDAIDEVVEALDDKIDISAKGVANGVAELDSTGKVPSSQLPSFVDDVIEVADYDHLPATGETGKIYVTLNTNKTYRWGGTEYVEISESLALGETSSTAYRGDRGKAAYDHSQLTSGNPHNVTKSEVGLGNVDNTSDSTKKTNFTGSIASGNTGFVTGGDAYTALSGKADKVSSATNGNLAGLNATGNPTDSGISGDMTTQSATGNPISIADLKSAQIALNPIITFEPIQAGSGIPSPSNVRAISGYDKIEVLSCEKNLFDGTYSVTNAFLQSDNTEYPSNNWNISQYIPVKANTAYYFSNLSGATSACICWYNKAKEFISSQSITEGFTATSPVNACYVRASIRNDKTNVCINEGSSAITYEDYHKTTDLSESLGQTVYGLEHYPRTGKASITLDIVDLGDLEWGRSGGGNFYAAISSKKATTLGVGTLVCASCYEVTVGAGFAVQNNQISDSASSAWVQYIFVADSRYTDATTFKTGIAGQKVIFIRATPTELQLTPHEIALSQGYNYISTNGTNISLAYHNGELASLADVEQLAETVNGLGEYVDAQRDILRFDYSTLSMADALLKLEEVLLQDKAYIISLLSTGDTVNGTYLRCGSYRTFLGSAAYNGKIYSCHRYGSNATWTIKSVTPT